MSDPSTITRAVEDWNRGDDGAGERLHELVYDELRRLAHGQLRKAPRGQSLQSTELVHEAYARVAQRQASFDGRGHFLAVCCSAMRHVLVDAARKRMAQKRGSGAVVVTLEESLVGSEQQAERVLAVAQALGRLEAIDERLVSVVDCRFFAGLTEDETAQALCVTTRTVQRDWVRARAWLKKTLDG